MAEHIHCATCRVPGPAEGCLLAELEAGDWWRVGREWHCGYCAPGALAVRVAELEAEVERLRAALRPFAEYILHFDAWWSSPVPDSAALCLPSEGPQPTMGDCRKAAEVLKETPDGNPAQT